MAWTQKGRDHEEKMQKQEIDGKLESQRMSHDAALASQKSREEHEAAEAARDRAHAKKLAHIKADADVRIAAGENETKLRLAETEKEIQETEQREETNRKKIEETEETKRTFLRETEETKRFESDQVTRRAGIEANRQISIKELEYKETAVKEMTNMFNSYMKYVSEAYKAEIDFLIKENLDRKEKFLATLQSTREEKAHILELSKEAKGQEKLDYLNKSDELEETIRMLLDKDSKDEENMKAQLQIISYKQDRDRAEGQKMIPTNTLLLDVQGDMQ